MHLFWVLIAILLVIIRGHFIWLTFETHTFPTLVTCHSIAPISSKNRHFAFVISTSPKHCFISCISRKACRTYYFKDIVISLGHNLLSRKLFKPSITNSARHGGHFIGNIEISPKYPQHYQSRIASKIYVRIVEVFLV